MFRTLHLTAEPTVRDVLSDPGVDPHRCDDPDRLAGRTVRAGESATGRDSFIETDGRATSVASVADRRVGRPPKVDDDSVAARGWPAACGSGVVESSSASMERPGSTSPPVPTCGPRRSTTISAARWSCSWRPRGTGTASASGRVGRLRSSGRGAGIPVCGVPLHAPPPGRDPRSAARYPEVAALLAEWHAERRSCGPRRPEGTTTQW